MEQFSYLLRRAGLAATAAVLCITSASAAGTTVPPPGIELAPADRTELQKGLEKLHARIQALHDNPLLPDVQIFYNAVRYALDYGEFFKPQEVFRAGELLRMGQARAEALAGGRAPWTTETGLVVRGYVSKIDRSVQPYGLVVPSSYSPALPRKWRLDTWFHGRNETLSEVNFLWDRLRNPGEFTPPNTLVLHLYGRYCNANKLAGEVDLFEALDAVRAQYPIDENRIVVRGFSMGGAAAWHFAAHYAGLWAAAAPGAGFAETPEFLRVWQKETVSPPWWEQKLWHLYNATDYAANLYNCPTVAYSGEIDAQRQAANIMAEALASEGMRLTHIIGPNTPHRYHPDSKVQIDRIVDAAADRGRDPFPRRIRFTTWTLRYNRMKWVVADALEKHWERARIDATVTNDHTVEVKTANVSAFSLDPGPGQNLFDPDKRVTAVIDGQHVETPGPETDRSWEAHYVKTGSRWTAAPRAGMEGLHKKHGLQGPVDDAFLDSFLFVRPGGTPLAPGIANWVSSEQEHAIREWRRQFRGEAQVKNDADVTDADIAASNLVLWGDPSSNRVLARIADKLPIRWTGDGIIAGGKKYPLATSALILIYPNPLNPDRYVVLNSGFTFREYDYLNNARQIPKLPDWAVVDTTTPPDDRYPGRIADAGFFGEKWELQTEKPGRAVQARLQ